MPLRRENGFLPDLDAIPADVAEAREDDVDQLPEQPDGRAGDARRSTREVVAFAQAAQHHRRQRRRLLRDVLRRRARRSPFLETPGARDVGIEFQSLSKTYNMTGWRIGFAVGNAAAGAGARQGQDQHRLGRVRGGAGGGGRGAVVVAGARSRRCAPSTSERREVLCGGLQRAGFEVLVPKATFYVLVVNPKGLTSTEFVSRLLDAGVVATPATGFGACGEGLRAADAVRGQGAAGGSGGAGPTRARLASSARLAVERARALVRARGLRASGAAGECAAADRRVAAQTGRARRATDGAGA